MKGPTKGAVEGVDRSTRLRRTRILGFMFTIRLRRGICTLGLHSVLRAFQTPDSHYTYLEDMLQVGHP